MALTMSVWITRERTTLNHVKGLLEALNQQGLLDYGEVRIIALTEGAAFEIPAGFRLSDNSVLGGGIVREIDLPAEGLLVLPDPAA